MNTLYNMIFCLELEMINNDSKRNIDKLNAIIADEFIEFASSGNIYTKSNILEILPKTENLQINIYDFRIMELNDGIILATYKTEKVCENPVIAIRSSIWKNFSGYWKIIFHQGTNL
jgi:hypothetical protein